MPKASSQCGSSSRRPRMVVAGGRTQFALAIVVGAAVMREGAEVVLFLFGVAAGEGTGQPTGEDRRLQLLCTLAGRTIEGPGKLQGHLGVIGDGQPFGQVRTAQVHQR